MTKGTKIARMWTFPLKTPIEKPNNSPRTLSRVWQVVCGRICWAVAHFLSILSCLARKHTLLASYKN